MNINTELSDAELDMISGGKVSQEDFTKGVKTAAGGAAAALLGGMVGEMVYLAGFCAVAGYQLAAAADKH